ncbi:MAG TPA: aminoglycoside 6-adenylyltransferase [Candidatus Limnocylindria bacterium]|nr:aminoglycoside 6-adenylyltransferase [Candidatus Limnocylindria bacterium]
MSGDPYDRLLERLTEAVQDDPRIEGLLLYGSRARGEADAWSDMDVGVVTTDSTADEVVRDRATLIRQVGEPLFLEDFGNPANVHVILADGVAFELIVRPVGELVDDGPHRLVLDKHGQLAAALSRKATKAAHAASDEDVRQLIHYFWHEVEHVVTALGRGQLLWAHGGLEAMRGICLRLARLSAGLPPEDDEPYWKVDRALDAALLERLRVTVRPAELPAMSHAAGELLDIYRSLARPLAERHGLVYPERLDALVSARLPR